MGQNDYRTSVESQPKPRCEFDNLSLTRKRELRLRTTRAAADYAPSSV
jgi:hypothetical protein